MRISLIWLALAIFSAPLPAGTNHPNRLYEVRAVYETGVIRVQKHSIQFGKNGTEFDYVRYGNQNILFPFQRGSFELHLKPRHTFVFLYQPLDIRTATTLTTDLILDTDTFFSGTPLNLRYGFDFYRLSWLYDLWQQPDRELNIGLSLQLRNASIAFSSIDGEKQRVYQNLGPVPALKARLRLPLKDLLWWAVAVDNRARITAGVKCPGMGSSWITDINGNN